METASAFIMSVDFYHITLHRSLKTVIFVTITVRISDLADDLVLICAFVAVKALNLNIENTYFILSKEKFDPFLVDHGCHFTSLCSLILYCVSWNEICG